MILHLIHDQTGTFLNYTMNSGLFSLHNYVISQFVWLLQSTTPLLSFSSEHLSSSFPPFHLCIIPLTSPFLQLPSFLLILCHLLPSSFSAICLHSVCASREFPFRLWGELRFSLLRSSLVLLLYVFHAGKGSYSCMQQGVCSVCGCPIRDPTMWCYNLPIHKDPLSISLTLSLAALFSLFLQDFHALIFFPISDYFILFSLTYFLNLFIWLLHLWLFPPYMHSLSLSLSLPPNTLTHLKWLLFPV